MSSRRIVLDANILIRAVLGRRVPELIEQYGADLAFFTPELAFTEAERHLPAIAERRGHDATALLESLSRLRAIVDTVTEDAISPLKQAALARIGSRDPMDWPVVAAALALDCPIWTEDRSSPVEWCKRFVILQGCGASFRCGRRCWRGDRSRRRSAAQ